MRYIVRAIKYFVQISITMTLILLILMSLKLVSWDVNVAFANGWNSVFIILGMFAAVSAIYPLFGYGKRQIVARGEPSGHIDIIKNAMEEKGYELFATADDGAMKFRLRSIFARIFRLWEDVVTITPNLEGFSVEGLSRDIARIASSLTFRLRNDG